MGLHLDLCSNDLFKKDCFFLFFFFCFFLGGGGGCSPVHTSCQCYTGPGQQILLTVERGPDYITIQLYVPLLPHLQAFPGSSFYIH